MAAAASVVSTSTTEAHDDHSTAGDGSDEITDHNHTEVTASMSVHQVEAEGEIDPDDLFFSNESFDDLRAHAAATGDLSDASDNEDDQPPSKKAASFSSAQVNANSPSDDDNDNDNENADTIFF
jgi:hypothetical protein